MSIKYIEINEIKCDRMNTKLVNYEHFSVFLNSSFTPYFNWLIAMTFQTIQLEYRVLAILRMRSMLSLNVFLNIFKYIEEFVFSSFIDIIIRYQPKNQS